MCQTHETHKDSRSGTNKHIYTIPEGDVGGDKELLCDNLSVNNITIWLHLSQRRNSEALPPTGSGEKDLQQMDGLIQERSGS